MKLANIVMANLINDLSERTFDLILPNFHMMFEDSGIKWECDLFQLTKNNWTIEYEVKVNKNDFKNDFNKSWWGNNKNTPKKHDFILNGNRTNRFYFVIPEQFLNDIELIKMVPKKYGIITFDLDKLKNTYKIENFKYFRTAGVLHKEPTKYDRFVHKTALNKYKYLYMKLTRTEIELMEAKNVN